MAFQELGEGVRNPERQPSFRLRERLRNSGPVLGTFHGIAARQLTLWNDGHLTQRFDAALQRWVSAEYRGNAAPAKERFNDTE